VGLLYYDFEGVVDGGDDVFVVGCEVGVEQCVFDYFEGCLWEFMILKIWNALVRLGVLMIIRYV